MTEPHFPTAFAELEPHAGWALPTERQRLALCGASTMEAIRDFYDAMTPRIREVLDYLNARSLSDFDDQEAALMFLALAYIEAAMAVEMYDEPACHYCGPVEALTVCNDPFEYKPERFRASGLPAK